MNEGHAEAASDEDLKTSTSFIVLPLNRPPFSHQQIPPSGSVLLTSSGQVSSTLHEQLRVDPQL